MDALVRSHNLLVFSPEPGEESLYCGGLIARCCRRGRPPQVIVQSAGPPATLARRGDAVRSALAHLGLPEDRLFLAEREDDRLPGDGPDLDAMAREVALVAWRHDCTILCAPWGREAAPGRSAAFRIAAAVARGTGLGLLAYRPDGSTGPEPGWRELRLDVTPDLARKGRAVAAYAMPPETAGGAGEEVFLIAGPSASLR